MNWPNFLTVLRFVLTFIFIYLIYQNGFTCKLWAGIVFLTASLTDYFDGFIAKKYGLVSDFGKIMDPIADKFLMLSAFYIFAQMQMYSFLFFFIIFIREFFITGIRMVAMKKGHVLAAENLGRYKTVAQIVAVYVILIYIVLSQSHVGAQWSQEVHSQWYLSIDILMWIAVIFTLVSGLTFLINNKKSYLSSKQ